MRPIVPRPDPFEFLRKTEGFETGPVVISVSPSTGRIGGGETVTITGLRFIDGATVLFGTVPGVNVTWISSNTLTVEAPPHVAEIVDITVTNFNGESSTLTQPYVFLEARITSVSFARGPVTGGTSLSIFGFNFVAGSIVRFGGIVATSVVFVDDTLYRAVTPAHAVGLVDIQIEEPGGAIAYGRAMFAFTNAIFGGDIRRNPSVNIVEATDAGVNRADFTVDGQGVPPVGLERVTFKDKTDKILFSGQVVSFEQSFEESPDNLVFRAGCTDHSFRFNRKRPFGLFNQVSASDVGDTLVAQYAVGFSNSFIQRRLPKISLQLDGSEDMITVFRKIASKLPNGHFYIDFDLNVHLFMSDFEQTLVPPVTAPGFGAAAFTLSVSTNPTDSNWKRGYWYFFSSFRYGTATTFTTPHASIPIPPSPGYVQLSDQAATLNLTGQVSNGSYGTGFKRGWVMYDGAGVRIGEGWAGHAPPVAGDVVFASQDVATVLENLAGGGRFDTKLSALAGPLYFENFLPKFDNIPLGPDVGGRPCTARVIYALRITDVALGGGSPLVQYAIIADNVTTSVTPTPDIKPSTISRSLLPPLSPVGTTTPFESTTNINTTVFPEREADAGYWSFRVTGVYEDGTETRGTTASPSVLLGGTKKVTIPNLPTFPLIGTLECKFRIIYASIFLPNSPLVFGIPDFDKTNTKKVALILDNTSVSATFAFGASLTGGERALTNIPPGAEDEIGPNLEEAFAPDPIDDNNTSLLLDSPITLTIDWNQIRNKVMVRGKGTILALDAAQGATSLTVADISRFSATGGKISVGSLVLDYLGVVGSTQIRLAAPLTQPILQADWLFGGGTPIRPFIIMEDLESQQMCGLVETDNNGLPSDGVHEFMVTNDDLLSPQAMTEAGLLELNGAWPIRTIRYATRDPKSHRGVTVECELSKPPIYGKFVLTDVTIDQYYNDAQELAPRYAVEATSLSRFTFNDFLRYLNDKTVGSGGSFPTPNVYASLNTMGGFVYHETIAIRLSGDTVGQEYALRGTVLSVTGVSPNTKFARGFMWMKANVPPSAGASADAFNDGSNHPIALEHLPQMRAIVMTGLASENMNGGGTEGGYQWALFPAGGVQPSGAGQDSGISIAMWKPPGLGTTEKLTVMVRDMLGAVVIQDILGNMVLDTVYDLQINFTSPTSFVTVINGVQKAYSFAANVFPALKYFRVAGRVSTNASNQGMWVRYAKVSSDVLA